MRIGLDASALVKEAAGIGQWITHVIDNLMKLDKENEYFLFTYDEIKIPYKLNDNWQIAYYGGEKKKQLRISYTYAKAFAPIQNRCVCRYKTLPASI